MVYFLFRVFRLFRTQVYPHEVCIFCENKNPIKINQLHITCIFRENKTHA